MPQQDDQDSRTLDEVLRVFEEAHAAAAPVYDMAQLAADPHMIERGAVVDLDGTPMQGLVARLSQTPGRLRWAGRPLGADTDEVWQEAVTRLRAEVEDGVPDLEAPHTSRHSFALTAVRF